MQREDYLQTAGAQLRKRRVGEVLLRTCHISGGVCVGGGGRRGRARKDRHSSTQRPKLSPTTAGHFSGTFSSGWGSEGAGGGCGQPLSNVDSVETTREYHCSSPDKSDVRRAEQHSGLLPY